MTRRPADCWYVVIFLTHEKQRPYREFNVWAESESLACSKVMSGMGGMERVQIIHCEKVAYRWGQLSPRGEGVSS